MDASLVSLLKQDDREAFAILYDQFWKPMLSYAGKRLVLPQDAEEVVQEVFVSLWERRHSLDIHGSLDAYLHAAIRYRIYNRYRDYLKRKQAFKIPGLEDVDYGTNASDVLECRELEKKLQQAMNALPGKCKQAFLLSREEKLSNTTIAKRLGISVNTVEKHIGKALQLLRLKLKDDLTIFIICAAGYLAGA